MGKRRARDDDGRSLGFLERVMFSFMGPPQVGENKAPEGFAPDPQAELCHRCGRPWDGHERVHTGTMTYRRCPAAPEQESPAGRRAPGPPPA